MIPRLKVIGDAIGLWNMLDVDGVSLVGLGALFSILPIWAIWLGVELLRRSVPEVAMSPIAERKAGA